MVSGMGLYKDLLSKTQFILLLVAAALGCRLIFSPRVLLGELPFWAREWRQEIKPRSSSKYSKTNSSSPQLPLSHSHRKKGEAVRQTIKATQQNLKATEEKEKLDKIYSREQEAEVQTEDSDLPQARNVSGYLYKFCARPNGTRKVGLRGLPVRLPRAFSKEDLFVTRSNYQRLLTGNLAIRPAIVPFLPESMEVIASSFAWRSCAVVGNSGSLRFTQFGKAVNSHDVVLRTNQAPVYKAAYQRLVGNKTTFRMLNRLWTAHYATRMYEKNLPLETGTWLLLSRTDGHVFEKLATFLEVNRPDVRVLMLTSRVVAMARRLLLSYRIRLCAAGQGPYKGGAVPSSGLVAVFLFMQLCSRVAVYGFGRDEATIGRRRVVVPYHYFVGHQARAEGVDVHSWPAEEKLLTALHDEGRIQFCRPIFKSDAQSTRNNFFCGFNLDSLPKGTHERAGGLASRQRTQGGAQRPFARRQSGGLGRQEEGEEQTLAGALHRPRSGGRGSAPISARAAARKGGARRRDAPSTVEGPSKPPQRTV
uniref:Cmp-n-acetylneuraminate-beta-galactosamide-alpha--sialyltransferase 1 n=1 Tax=Tetraselmis sp. GSL018 TaxID=582737 RepID=A0A061SFE5_9CHLO|mmetsp:Transcript_30164/g.71829  ORF Transcript_30164/g.71829 Transcript_30164/m.71829 type:complete len:533 (+) Transcript_30164:507-2105(+)